MFYYVACEVLSNLDAVPQCHFNSGWHKSNLFFVLGKKVNEEKSISFAVRQRWTQTPGFVLSGGVMFVP